MNEINRRQLVKGMAMQKEIGFLALKKMHVVFVAIVGITTPVITGYASYNRAIEGVNERISSLQLEAQKQFVTKDDFKPMSIQVNKISNDIAEIKGFLKQKRRFDNE